MTGYFSRYLLCGAALVALMPVAGMAQTEAGASEGGIEDIVVTAQRREQSLQEVPLAISAVSAASLEASGVKDINSLQQVAPGLQTINQRGALTPYLRGVGTQNSAAGDEPSIALYVDGVYYPSMAGNILSLANVERVEVLRGPQGTLFGRNATGGLVQLITRTPTQERTMEASIGYASYQTITGSAYISGGLTDNIAIDLSLGFTNQNKGWGRNITTGEEVNYRKDFAARSKLVWDVSDNFRVTLAADYARINSDIGNTRTAALNTVSPGNILIDGQGLIPGTKVYDTRANEPRSIHTEQGGASLKLDLELGTGTLTSTTAFRKYHSPAVFDQDGTPLDPPFAFAGANAARNPLRAYLNDRTKTFQQELLYNYGSDALDLTAGLFYFHANAKWDPIGLESASFAVYGGERLRYATQKTNSYAAFAQGTYHITPSTGLTAGLRYTRDERNLSAVDRTVFGNVFGVATGPLTQDQLHPRFNKLTWRFALEQKFGDDILAYASYSRGFKSGVFNLTSTNLPPVRPEQLDSYAVGFKSDLFDRMLRVNVEGFYYDYKDIQLTLVAAGGTQLLNAAQSRVKGVDFEVQFAPPISTGKLLLSANGEFLDAKYKSFQNAPLFIPPSQPKPAGAFNCSTQTVGNQRCSINASGFDMIIAPDFSGNASVDYQMPISENNKIGFNVNYYYNSGFTWHPDNRIRQRRYGLVGGQVMFGDIDDAWSLKVWGQNLTKKIYYTSYSHAEYGDQAGPGAPRTYGVTASFKFR